MSLLSFSSMLQKYLLIESAIFLGFVTTFASTSRDEIIAVLGRLLINILIALQASLIFPSQEFILSVKYSCSSFEFIALVLMRTCLQASINMQELDLMAAGFSLSRVLHIFLLSGFSQGVDLSDTLRSIRGACFSITKDSMLVQFCTTSLISWLHMRILCQFIAARSLRNSSSLTFLILTSFDNFMIARVIMMKLMNGIHQIVITKYQYKDPRLNYVTCNVDSDVINYGRCVNSLSGRLIYKLLKPKRIV